MIAREIVEKALHNSLRQGGDFADIYVERKVVDNLRLEDGKIESFSSGNDIGIGLRVISGASTYFVHTDGLSSSGVLAAADELAAAVKAQSGKQNRLTVYALKKASPTERQHVLISPISITQDAKAEIARRADASARAVGREIAQVTVMLGSSVQDIAIANSEGLYAEDRRTLTRMFVFAVGKRGDRIESAHEAPGILGGFELFDAHSPEQIGESAARRAVSMLDAAPAPSGNMPVVLGNGTGGVLFHEACGHGLEADAVRKGASVFAGKIGQRVASDCVSASDNPALPNRWGSFGIDDEGIPASETVLIENGILRGFIYDRFNARLLKADSTPNGRRQSFRHIPIPRMTNTYIKEGPDEFVGMLAGIKRGFYAKSLGGGEVNPANGDYVFGVTEGYLIEEGQVTSLVRGAVLVGNGPQTLKDIEMVGSDLDFDAGMCGKAGQSVPAGTGQPSLRIKGLTVGGTGQ